MALGNAKSIGDKDHVGDHNLIEAALTAAVQRANHTGTQASSTVTGLDASLTAKLDSTLASATYRALPQERTIWALGDSITDQGNAGTQSSRVGRVFFQKISYLAWTLLQAPIPRLRYGGVAATPGFTSAQIVATHLPTVVAAAPAACFVLVGTNDPGTLTLTQTIANVKTIVNGLLAVGTTPILCTLPPGNTRATDNTDIINRNAFLTAYARDKGIPLVDFYSVLVDPATGQYRTSYSSDGIHPDSVIAAKALGTQAATVLASVFPQWTPFIFGSALNVAGSIPNATFTIDTNADGVPDGWIALAANGTGTTTLTDDPNVLGKKWTITRGDVDMLFGSSSSFTFAPGTRLLFAFRLKATAAGTNGRWSVRLENAANGPHLGFDQITGSTDGWTTQFFEITVPTLSTQVFSVQLYCQGGVGTSLELGQMTLLNLSALGLPDANVA